MKEFEDIDALCLAGDRHYEHGDLGDAEVCYRRALSVCRSERRAVIAGVLGEVLRQLGKVKEAVDVLESALACDPSRFNTLLSLGKALLDLQRTQEAAQVFANAVTIDGGDPEAHFYLGQAMAALGLLAPAEMAFRNVLHLRADDSVAYVILGRILLEQGRRDELKGLIADWESAVPNDHRLSHFRAAWSFADTPARASDGYIREAFDNSAAKFDTHLKQLGYCAPEKLVQALKDHGVLPGRQLHVLDAGCGTGLCGPLLRSMANRLVGVDLSAGMLERARQLGVYDELAEAELTQYLLEHPDHFDIVIFADTLVYFGDLAPIFRASSAALRTEGLLTFSLELSEDSVDRGFQLGEHGRYAHCEHDVLRQLEATGYECLLAERRSFRQEAGKPVAGLMVVGRKRTER